MKKFWLLAGLSVCDVVVIERAAQAAHYEIEDKLIEVSEHGGVGAYVENGDTLAANNVNIILSGNYSVGVKADGAGSVASIENSTIETSGYSNTGVLAENGGTAIVSNVSVTMSDTGLGLSAEGAGSTVAANGVVINSFGDQSFGIQSSGAGSLIEFTNGDIIMHGPYSTGVAVDSGGKALVSGSNIEADFGIDVYGGSSLTFNDSQLISNGFYGTAISSYSFAGGINQIEVNNSHIVVTGEESQILNVGIAGGTRHEFSINNSTLDAQNNYLYYAIRTIPIFSTAEDTEDLGSSMVHASGSILKGDIYISHPDFKADFSFQDSTHWTGAGIGINKLNLESDSVWNMTGDSTLRSLTLQNGRINFVHDDGQFKSLSADMLEGNGEFKMNVNLGTLEGDLLTVYGANGASGSHTLFIDDSGQSAEKDALLRVVDTNGGNAVFNLYGGYVDAGAFRYGLEQRGDDWFLSSSGDLSKGADAAVGNQAAAAALIATQMGTLVQRTGELRMGHDEGGVWTRTFGNQQRIDTGTSRVFTQQVNGTEIGADKAVTLSEGTLYIGGMVGSGRGRQTFDVGTKGTTDSAIFGGYATYINNDGVYVDGVVKFAQLDSKLNVVGNSGEVAKAKSKNHAVSAAVEVGKHIDLDSGWYIEPQLQLQVTHISENDYVASNGLAVEQTAVDSLQSRIGGLLGHQAQLDNGMIIQPYIKASWVAEYAGKSSVRVNDVKLNSKLPGSRVEFGGGVVVQVADKHRVFLDGDYSKGADTEQPWSVNVGYRYLW